MGRGERLPHNNDRYGHKACISEEERPHKGPLSDMHPHSVLIQVPGEEDKPWRHALHAPGDTRHTPGHELPVRGRGGIHTRIRED